MIANQRLMLALAFYSISYTPLVSQKVSVKFGDVIDVPTMVSSYAGCAVTESGGYLLNFHESDGLNTAKVLVNNYDKIFKLKDSKKYESSLERSKTVAVSYSKGKLGWVVSQRPEGMDSIVCSLTTASIGGEFGKHKPLFSIYSKRSSILRTQIQHMTSLDSSKQVIYAIYDKEDQDARPSINLAVMDDAFNKLWSKKIELGYTERRLKALSWAAMPNGEVYMLAKIYGNDRFYEAVKKDGKRVPDYKLVIFQFSKDVVKPKEYELKFGDLFVNGPAIFANRQNELTCAGFFAESHTGNSVGVFQLRLNGNDGNILAMKKHEFDKEDIKHFGEFEAKKDKDGNWGLSSDFNFKQVHFGNDGDAVLFAEYTLDRIERSGSVSSGDSKSRHYYYKNGVAVFQVDSDGNFTTIRLIKKIQSLTTEYFGGFASLSNESGLYVFYGDHEDNLEKGLDDKIKPMTGFNKNTMPIVAIQSPDGEIKRKQLYDIKAMESLILPTQNVQINDHQLLFVAMKPEGLLNWNYQLGLITVKD